MQFLLFSLLALAAWLAFISGAIATMAGFFGRTWWVFDLFSHFRWQYFLLLFMSAILFLILRQLLPAGGALSLALINLALILPLYLNTTTFLGAVSAQAGSQTYRLLLANVLQSNQKYGLVATVIETEKPDFIILVEVNRPWIVALTPVLEAYPHRLMSLRGDNFGLALFSRFPIENGEVLRMDGLPVPTLAAHFELEGQHLTLIGTHPPPPKGGYLSKQRNIQFSALARYADSLTGHVMLAGDLNTSSWSPHFQDLVKESGLRDSRQGFGMQLSWPTNRPFLLTPIDHVLVSPDLDIVNRRTGIYTGSDHYPIILDFSIEYN